MQHIVIIGNGIAGITCARHIRKKSDYKITVISAESEHFFSRTALMYIYMGHMKYEHTKPYEDWFWKKNRIDLIKGLVTNIAYDQKMLSMEDGSTLSYDKLVLALGSTPNFFGWPGQDLNGVQGMYSLQDLEAMEARTKGISQAVIVGGGLIGVEMAEMLLTRNIHVTFLVRESMYWRGVLPQEESEMVTRHVRSHGVDLQLSTELKEIIDDGQGGVGAVISSTGNTLPCQFLGITAGVRPNIDWLKETDLETDKGILVDNTFQTNMADVYAIGDCAQYRTPPSGRKSIEPIWYTGRIHGETLAQTLTGNPTEYQPGVFFNSAKFFDIEYQVYGEVKADHLEHQDSLYWEHPEGDKAIRIVYNKDTLAVEGFNLMGIRYRHEVMDRWIKTGKKLPEVLSQLEEANFDPEFHGKYESQLRKKYNNISPEKPVARKKKSVLQMIFG